VPRRPLITLITDFGTVDHLVGTVKGVILNINPDVEIVDICHEIASFDIFDAALTLAESYRFFPSDTIHLVVVDPGVGSTRRPILARSLNYRFVAPDNGVLSLVYEREEALEVRHITASHYFLTPTSNTFHGRDIFAPVAAWLSKSVEADKFGEPISDFVRFASPKPKRLSENLVKGVVLKVDKFGNLVTNLRPEDIPDLASGNPSNLKFIINQHEITHLYASYSMGKGTEPFAIVGSSGFIEISLNRGSAAKALNANRGAEVSLVLEKPTPPAE
jgi:S-adenosyl-L-methionine hydrolase (adenosine-forming)